MLRRITSILLFVVLTGGNAATAGSSSQKASRSPQHHCKMARTTTAPLVSCCQHAPVPRSEETNGKEAWGCCQMSAPMPDQPRPALPGNSSEEFRIQTQAQLLDSSEPVSASALTSLLEWVSSTIRFYPDRSDTYLLASTFRI
jgi:hypothetical protein